MPKFWAALNGAWQVLTFSTMRAPLPMLAKFRPIAGSAIVAPLPMLAKAGPPTLFAILALLLMLAQVGAPTLCAALATFPVLADANSAAGTAPAGLLPMRTFLINSFNSLYWMLRRRGWH
jgi:hypothetical protein